MPNLNFSSSHLKLFPLSSHSSAEQTAPGRAQHINLLLIAFRPVLPEHRPGLWFPRSHSQARGCGLADPTGPGRTRSELRAQTRPLRSAPLTKWRRPSTANRKRFLFRARFGQETQGAQPIGNGCAVMMSSSCAGAHAHFVSLPGQRAAGPGEVSADGCGSAARGDRERGSSPRRAACRPGSGLPRGYGL